MVTEKEILIEAEEFARDILKNKVPKELVYHNLNHTIEVVNAVLEIGRNSGLNDEEIEIALLASWFHDLGFMETVENHENCSASIAQEFLKDRNYPDDKIVAVIGAILSTKMPQSPKTRIEEVVCDADLYHLSTSLYEGKAKALRKEWKFTNSDFSPSDREWLEMNIEFIEGQNYFTTYAVQNLAKGKAKNLKKIKKQLKSLGESEETVQGLQNDLETLKGKLKNAKRQKPDRGIETMFRTTSKNHLDLSAMADNKANIMISINSIILSILVSVLYRKLEEYPHMIIPTLILTCVCLVTIVLAILSTRPTITAGKFTKQDIERKKTNLLFFGNFHSMNLKDYEWGMREMMQDADYLYGSMIKDIYFLGVVLGKKYKYLRWAYTIFMFGFVISVLSFIGAELFLKEPY